MAAFGFIYFDYGEQQRQSAINITTSLLRQWADCQKELDPGIRALYAKLRSEQKRPRLADCIQCLKPIANSFPSAFIIIDALDECNRDERIIFLDVLRKLSPSVKIFATSRPQLQDVQNFFGRSIIVSISAQREDLELYLRKEVDKKHMELERKEKIIRELSTQANGLLVVS